jgi:homoserine kinase type II
MASLTRLEAAAARKLLAEWGLELHDLTPLPAHGTVNSNFLVAASDGQYFLRINEGKHEDDVRKEAWLVERLRRGGLPTPEVVPTRGGAPFARHAGKPVTLFPWIDGYEAEPNEVELAGLALGLLHMAAAGLPDDALPRDHYALDLLAGRVASFADDPRLPPGLSDELFAEIARGRRRPPPDGLIHQDLFPDNVLSDGQGGLLAVLDLEQATRGRHLYDLAVAINAWCFTEAGFDAAAMERLLRAYLLSGPHAAIDRSTLGEELRLSAARFTITRITDIHLREVDPDLKRRKDYRDYLRRLRHWQSTSG